MLLWAGLVHALPEASEWLPCFVDNPVMTTTLNVDPAELAKFSDLAHRWWDKESEFRPLHQINPLRLDWLNGLCPVQGKRVLDVGCGGGILADAMALPQSHSLVLTQVVKFASISQMAQRPQGLRLAMQIMC